METHPPGPSMPFRPRQWLLSALCLSASCSIHESEPRIPYQAPFRIGRGTHPVEAEVTLREHAGGAPRVVPPSTVRQVDVDSLLVVDFSPVTTTLETMPEDMSLEDIQAWIARLDDAAKKLTSVEERVEVLATLTPRGSTERRQLNVTNYFTAEQAALRPKDVDAIGALSSAIDQVRAQLEERVKEEVEEEQKKELGNDDNARGNRSGNQGTFAVSEAANGPAREAKGVADLLRAIASAAGPVYAVNYTPPPTDPEGTDPTPAPKSRKLEAISRLAEEYRKAVKLSASVDALQQPAALLQGIIDVRRSGAEHGDRIEVVVNLVHKTSKNPRTTEPAKPAQVENPRSQTPQNEERKIVAQRMYFLDVVDSELTTTYSASFILSRPDSRSGQPLEWDSNFAASVNWGYRIKNPETNWSKGWNWLRPAVGLHVASLNQEDDQIIEFGIGPNVSFWDGILELGLGYNMSVDDDHLYYFIGTDLLRLLGATGRAFE